MKDAFLKSLREHRVVAIVRGGYGVSSYEQIAHALSDAGIPLVEFTIDNPAALDGIRAVKARESRSWLGAGTVRSQDDARKALEAGADFLVSPGYVAGVADVANEAGVAYLPGVLTPTEIEMACAAGCNTVKLFPAQPLGPAYLKSLAQPLATVDFVPTGGVDPDNAADFLRAGAVAVGLGSSLIGRDGEYGEIADRSARLLERLNEVPSR